MKKRIFYIILYPLSARAGLLPAVRVKPAESEAADHDQRQRAAAHGSRQRQRLLRHQVLRLRPERVQRGYR